jgi:pilus assembly protein CpaE
MVPETLREDPHRSAPWPWRTALVVQTPSLGSGVAEALDEFNARCIFRVPVSTPRFEVAHLVERERPDILFVETGCIEGPGAEWIAGVRAGGDSPLIVAVHPDWHPQTMIDALRAGASEFLSLPLRPAIFEAMDRLATLLEARQAQSLERGRMTGILSAKGGCGATTVACHLGAALHAAGAGKVLILDLDSQAPSAHRVFRVTPGSRVGNALESARRLNAACWPDFTTAAFCGVDLLAGQRSQAAESAASAAEPWRVDALFRFLSRSYSWVLADLGRHLNPSNWSFLQNLDELIVVTAPDVLALYQTRCVLQTLSGRGFEKERLRLVLNRNHSAPQDFWVESIEQMFEMSVISVIPDDNSTLGGLPRDRFEFPAHSGFGRAVTKLAARLMKPCGSDTGQKGTARKAA